MTSDSSPLGEGALGTVGPWVEEILQLPPAQIELAIKALHEHDMEDGLLSGVALGGRQLAALVVDQVRLAQLRQLDDQQGELASVREQLAARTGASVAVLSGAGISVDAGFPTFRGGGTSGEGLWEKEDPMLLASTQGFAADPMRSLRWYCWRRSLGLPAVPTLAHAALAAAQATQGERWAGCHTQNVDGLHEAAGNQGVNRIHGSIWCWKDRRTGELIVEPSDQLGDIPRRPDGEPSVRPGVVLFGDNVPYGVYRRAERELARADVALVVGTAAQVSTLWPLLDAAIRGGATLVEVNPDPSPVTTELGALSIPLPSGIGVPLALETLGAISRDDTERLARTPRRSLRDALPDLRAEFLADA